MMDAYKSNAEILLEQLKAEGKATYLSDEQVAAMDAHMHALMHPYRSELRRKQAQSWRDTANIVLTD